MYFKTSHILISFVLQVLHKARTTAISFNSRTVNLSLPRIVITKFFVIIYTSVGYVITLATNLNTVDVCVCARAELTRLPGTKRCNGFTYNFCDLDPEDRMFQNLLSRFPSIEQCHYSENAVCNVCKGRMGQVRGYQVEGDKRQSTFINMHFSKVICIF